MYGLKPWFTYADSVDKLNTGDIILLSAKSPVGKTIKKIDKTNFSKVGVILRRGREVFILSSCIPRYSLYLDGPSKVKVTGEIQQLSSVIFSDFYDLIAVRQLKFSKSVDQFFAIENSVIGQDEDRLFLKLVEASKQLITIRYPPKKFELLISKFYENSYIKCAEVEETSCLVSAEYVAYLFTKVKIFTEETIDQVPKFRPSHFASSTTYQIPWNKDFVATISPENYVFLDHVEQYEDVITTPGDPPKMPAKFPIKMGNVIPNVFITGYLDLEPLKLYSGDLIFFQQTGEVAESIQKITQCSVNLVGMFIKLPNIELPFVMTSPALYLNKESSKTNQEKLIETRVISLDSLIESGAYSKIFVRRLLKKGKEDYLITRSSSKKLLGVPRTPRLEKKFTRGYSAFHLGIRSRNLTSTTSTNSNNSNNNNNNDGNSLELQDVAKSSSFIMRQEEQEDNSSLLYAAIQLSKKDDDVNWQNIRRIFQTLTNLETDFGDLLVNIGSVFSAQLVSTILSNLGLLKGAALDINGLLETTDLQNDYYLSEPVELHPLQLEKKKSMLALKKETFTIPFRDECRGKFFVTSNQYYADLFSILSDAKEMILICSTFLCPQTSLLRGPKVNYKEGLYRLDKVLLDRAKNGVKIFLLISENEYGTKDIQSLLKHENISLEVVGQLGTLRDHQTFVVVDQEVGYVGSTEIGYGRWENDYNLLDEEAVFYPGREFSNPVFGTEFSGDPYEDPHYVRRSNDCRMPWRDVQVRVEGDIVVDLLKLFQVRWDKVSKTAFPLRYKIPKFRMEGPKLNMMLLQSIAPWNSKVDAPEHSYLDTYLKLIEDSEYFIYIESQWFISNSSSDPNNGNSKIANKVARALLQRIIRAAEQCVPFRVYVVLPAQPPLDLTDSRHAGYSRYVSNMNDMHESLSRGESSLWKNLEKALQSKGKKISDFIVFTSLRKHGILKSNKVVSEMVYVHDNVMIVDDRFLIVGTASISDASLIDKKDSEVGILITQSFDKEVHLYGMDVKVSEFVHQFRKELWKTILMPDDYSDPMSYFFVWRTSQQENVRIYESNFKHIPNNTYTAEDLKVMLDHEGNGEKATRERMKQLQGLIMDFPFNFMKDENLLVHPLTKTNGSNDNVNNSHNGSGEQIANNQQE